VPQVHEGCGGIIEQTGRTWKRIFYVIKKREKKIWGNENELIHVYDRGESIEDTNLPPLYVPIGYKRKTFYQCRKCGKKFSEKDLIPPRDSELS
jgi:hypothetical protein